MSYNTGSAPPRRRSAKSNSEPSSNGSSPPASVNLTNGNNMNQVANNINLNAANNNNNAPKYGTLVPNRVFVGGISSTTTESELCQLFSKYGNVKATKIIADRAGVSKGYGFVTFETDEEAKRLQLDADNIILKERRLNIAPAIMKQGPQVRYERRDRRKKEEIIIQVEESVERNGEDQAFPQRGFDATASPPPMNALYLSNGIPYPCSYQNGTVFFAQPQLQAAPMPGAPDAPMYPGATYGPTQGPSPTYAPAMMYPYGNPGQMFIPPYQPYPQLQMASQPHMMYTNSTLQTLNNGTDTPSPISMSPHGTPPFFVQGDMRPDMFFIPPPAPGQAYPPFPTPVMLQNTAPEAVQYCEVPIEQQSTNVQGEVPQPTAEEAVVATNEVQNEVTPEPETHALAETPVVSAKLIHRTEEQKTEYRRNDRHVEVDHGRHGNGQKHNLNNNNSTYTNNNYYKKESGNSNGRGGGYRGGRGGHRMNGGCGRRNFHRSSASPETYSSPHPNNNVNTNLNLQHQNYPGRIHQLPYQASNTASHTTVVAAVGQQMQTAHAQYNMAHPPPPVPHHVPTNVPPRRFNLQHSNNQRRSYQNNHYGRKRGDAVDNGAAGDAPINNKELNPSSTAKGSPPPLVSSSEQDLLVSGMKKMNVQ